MKAVIILLILLGALVFWVLMGGYFDWEYETPRYSHVSDNYPTLIKLPMENVSFENNEIIVTFPSTGFGMGVTMLVFSP